MYGHGWGEGVTALLPRAAPSAILPIDNSWHNSFNPLCVGAKCPGLLMEKGLGVESLGSWRSGEIDAD